MSRLFLSSLLIFLLLAFQAFGSAALPRGPDADALEAQLPNKALAHAIVGGLAASLGGGNFLQGAAAAGLSEAASKELAEHIDDPLTRNLVSTLIGGIAGGTQGAIIAGTADKFNCQLHPTEIEFLEDEDRLERYRQHIAETEGRDISLEEAEAELKVAALYIVSQSWEDNLDIEAEVAAFAFLDAESQGHSYIGSDGTTKRVLVATQAEREDDFINLEHYDEVRKSLSAVLPNYQVWDLMEEFTFPVAAVHGAINELVETVEGAIDTH